MAIPDTITADMLKRMADEIDQKPMFTDLLISRGWRDQLVRVSTPPQKPEIDNPIYAGFTHRYHGIPYEVVDIPPEEVFDWSACRSPSRAKRRHARGIPQRVQITYRERVFLFDRRAFDARFEQMATKLLFNGK
jgi:hypothetical protein